ncbi:MAG: polyphosphate kinase 1, partial [Planctomycetota bacterium]
MSADAATPLDPRPNSGGGARSRGNTAPKTSLDRANPGLGNYFNRELSLLQFNYRVLQLAQDPAVPLLERLRFLSISSLNLDEFFEIRVAGLKQHLAFDVGLTSPEGLSPQEALRLVQRTTHELVEEQYRVLNDQILPALADENIHVIRRGAWSDEVEAWVHRYFQDNVLPVLTPVGLDPAHPFPRILNKSLNFIVDLKGKDAFGRSSRAAVVQAPRLLPRLIPIPPKIAKSPSEFVLLSSVIHANVNELFPGMKIQGCYQFRVTRDSDLWVDEEEVDDLLNALRGELLSRRFSGAVRLEVADNCTPGMQEFLLEQFEIDHRDIYTVNGPVNLHRLSALYDLVDRPELKYAPFKPGKHPLIEQDTSIFEAIRNGPMLLHHPYQSFSPVVELLSEAARDPDVLAIRQTVYRTGPDSPLVDALIDAARA